MTNNYVKYGILAGLGIAIVFSSICAFMTSALAASELTCNNKGVCAGFIHPFGGLVALANHSTNTKTGAASTTNPSISAVDTFGNPHADSAPSLTHAHLGTHDVFACTHTPVC